MPEIVVRCLPGGVLIGTTLCLYIMIKNREMVAYFSMRSVAGALCENGILLTELAAFLPCLIIATISGAFILLIKKV